MQIEFKLKDPIKSILCEFGGPRRGGGKTGGIRGHGGHQENMAIWPVASQLSRLHMDSQRLKQQTKEFVPCSLHICYSCWIDVFVGLLTMGAGLSLIVLFLLGPLFFLLVCLVQPWCDDFALYYYCFLFCPVWLLSLGGLIFPKGNRKGSGKKGIQGKSCEEQREGKLCSGCII